MPSREALLAFLSGAPAPNGLKAPARVSKRDVARAFNVKGEDRAALKTLLKDLQNDGAVTRGRKTLSRQGQLPAMLAADIVERSRDGDLIAKPTDWKGAGEAPRIRVRIPKLRRDKAPAPGMGARVLMRIELDPQAEGREPAYSGRVVKILDRAKGRSLGVYRELENGGGRVLPIEKRAIGREIFIPPGLAGEAVEGDLVAIEVLREGRFGMPSARVIERLGPVDTERAVSMIALAAHDIPHVFSPKTLAEAEAARPVTLDHREDWRELPLVTIDPVDAKDHDDAVHAQPDPDPSNKGGFILTVAIADVAWYVRPGASLDKEALERGNSVYFPDRVVPMLPERISNDLCSLKPDVDRPALAVRMIIGGDGRKRRHTFHRILMRSAGKLAYQQAQAAIVGNPDEITAPLLEPVLRPLWAAYEAMKQERGQREPLDLELPERKLILDKDGKLKDVRWPERLDAHKLIEECMILANVAAAETLEAANSPLIYRAHDAPSNEKVGEFLTTLGVKLAKGEHMKPMHFNRVLARVRGEATESLVNEVVLRAQAQAEYTHENYADLVVHRALIGALHFGPGASGDNDLRALADVAERISGAERRAMAAERETADRLIAAHLASQIGARFTARIAGVTKVGLFVKLTGTGADGFIPAATLGTDYFRFEEAHRALVGTRTGETFRLGDNVDVKLLEAAPFAGALRFEMLSRGSGRGASTARFKKERRR